MILPIVVVLGMESGPCVLDRHCPTDLGPCLEHGFFDVDKLSLTAADIILFASILCDMKVLLMLVLFFENKRY